MGIGSAFFGAFSIVCSATYKQITARRCGKASWLSLVDVAFICYNDCIQFPLSCVHYEIAFSFFLLSPVNFNLYCKPRHIFIVLIRFVTRELILCDL